MAQDINTQAQVTTTEAYDMKSKANQEVVPRENQQVATMTSHIRDFSRMNPPTLYGSKVEKDPYEFIDMIYDILYAMGLSTSEKA